jgi:hypothetical protein
MAITYTVRYSDYDDRMIRWLVMQCKDEKDAVRTAAAKMLSPYASLEISHGDEVIWGGSRDRVKVWSSSAPANPWPSYTARAS